MTQRSAYSVHLTPGERVTFGRQARSRVPRSAQGRFDPGSGRFDPVEVIETQSATRLPELVPLRYGRMLESPFRFYRGAAAIMAADLGATPDTGLTVQLCGDAHLLNFRLLASPERHLVFDINDFDETLAGPFEWDVKRLAASFAISARASGFTTAEQDEAVRECVRAYRLRMRELAGMRALDIWYAQDDADSMQALMASSMDKKARRRTAQATAKARTRTHMQAFAKLTADTPEGRRIAPDPPLITPLADLTDTSAAETEKELATVLDQYTHTLSAERQHLLRHYRLVDVARKVVGVGSVGTRCWILLLLGRDDDDPLLLQAKEAQRSVLAAHTGGDDYDNQGRRVVDGQRLIQTTSDILLGWTHVTGLDGRERDFYVRQLRDWKGIARPETMDPPLLNLFARLCGASLARAHARSGDPVAIDAYLGGSDRFDRALTGFAQLYADRNERDFEALGAAVRSGRVTARTA
ncbi:hypothetical protein BN159_8174 [Streptomyces davaonensis JCM 4913]|uniref:DUF2252 domain-containing protein n=1 Tax=Streptomyces davaonensis (strain DSM 101723 / JCM 4913 / KCC S-0913 / 768) TaxID=1214101 RepID=K4RFU5_STRDJ|nr:DUF2252 domain-containing protein [Streptomyces davaonensis]CCK32552.1 hypothetical protein BN159_8174 [Streptomyces davaonensis JCM 4913]